jgi:hypothetical protein
MPYSSHFAWFIHLKIFADKHESWSSSRNYHTINHIPQTAIIIKRELCGKLIRTPCQFLPTTYSLHNIHLLCHTSL